MQLSPQDEEFRGRVRQWLAENLTGRFAGLRGAGGPGREHEAHDERVAWNRHLAAAGLTCLGWPAEYGGHGATLAQQVIFYEEYARCGAPARVGYLGEELLGPTLIAFGTPEQKRRFLPAIAAVEEVWCQGYTEPGAGSDLAAVATTAALDGDQWVITGQKVWTSLAAEADWCFVLARTQPGSRRGEGLSYLLVPMRQSGITVRPIRQLTGTAEFSEVFFDGARTDRDLVVGEPGDGWRVARATLGIERGVATLGQQIGFERELGRLVEEAKRTGADADPLVRDKPARAWIGLEAMRAHALHTLAADQAVATGAESSVLKLLWSRWHQDLGELAMEAHYAATKAGVMALTRCAALDVAEHGIRVNAVAPSLATHPFLAKVTGEELLAELAGREAFGRAARPWEVATVIAFLASDYASYLTGEVISVSSQHP